MLDDFRPVLARLRIAALQAEVLAKNPLAKGVVRSQRTVVTPVRDASGSWKMGKKKVVRVRSNSSASSSASS